MKICILSDRHDNRFLLKSAITEACEMGAEAILHCGDVVAPSTFNLVKDTLIPIHVIHGNNTGDLYTMTQFSANPDSNIHYHGQDATIELANRKIFMVHYPHYAEGMALTGKWDIVCCGHSHRSKISTVTNILGTQTLILNPGTVGGVGEMPRYFICDLTNLTVEQYQLPLPEGVSI